MSGFAVVAQAVDVREFALTIYLNAGVPFTDDVTAEVFAQTTLGEKGATYNWSVFPVA